MFFFLPIVLVIVLIQFAIKNGTNLGPGFSNTTLGITIVFGFVPIIISILVYGAHSLISKRPDLSEKILKAISLLPYICFTTLILPQFFGTDNGSWLLSAIYGITGNSKGLHEFLLKDIFFDSPSANSLVLAILNIINIFQYFLIFGFYLNLYYWFNRKGSRDYHTPIMVELIASNRLVVLGFFLIAFLEVLQGYSAWQNVIIATSIDQNPNEFIRFILASSEILLTLAIPFVMLMIFPLLLPRIAGWKILQDCPELQLLKKTAKDNNFKYNKIYLASNPGLVTAGVIGIFSKTTNLLFTKDIFNLLNEKELEAVMLHEIGHSKYRHIIFYMLYFLLMESLILLIVSLFSFDQNILLSFYLALLLLSIRFGWGWISRQCERQADLNAAEVQGTPEHIVSSFYKISHLGHSLDKPSWHHGSLRERIDNLTNAFQSDGSITRKLFHRKIKYIKILVLLFFILVNGVLIYSNYFVKSNSELMEINRKSMLAINHLMTKNFKESEKHFTEVLTIVNNPDLNPKLLESKNQILLITYYNLACLYSLSGELDKAMDFLNKTLPLYDKKMISRQNSEALNVHKVETDPDLNSLRKLDSYLKFVEELKVIEKKFGEFKLK